MAVRVIITFIEEGKQKFKPFEKLISRGDVRVLSEDEWNLDLILESKDLEVIFEDDLLVITKGLSQLYTAEGVQAVSFRML